MAHISCLDWSKWNVQALVSKILFKCSHRNLGKMFQVDEHIFQMGWFNHQLGMVKSLSQGKNMKIHHLSS